MRNSHRQEPRDQVEWSFPINYKRLVFNEPTRETRVLQRILETVLPDFYYTLHNTIAGGGFFLLNCDIGQQYYQELYGLLRRHRIPLQANSSHLAWCPQFAQGVVELTTTRRLYDSLEKTTPHPERLLHSGGLSSEYLASIKANAVTFVAELPYVKHPSDGSTRETTRNLRQVRLRLDAENKFVATVIIEEWDKVEPDLDRNSPFYKKIFNGVISVKESLCEGLPSWPFKIQEILFSSAHGKTMTEGEQLSAYLQRFRMLCQSHEFVRLLKASTQTAAVTRATARVESVLDDALEDIGRTIDLSLMEAVDHDTLAKVQLGSGLIVLNSILSARTS